MRTPPTHQVGSQPTWWVGEVRKPSAPHPPTTWATPHSGVLPTPQVGRDQLPLSHKPTASVREPLPSMTEATSMPLVECPPARKKNLDHNIYRHTCLMNHQKTRLTSLMAPWDPLDALFDPLAPPGTPMNPLGPLNRSLGLKQTQDHLVCITNHQRTHQMSLPILWNILPFPLDPLGPCRPTP